MFSLRLVTPEQVAFTNTQEYKEVFTDTKTEEPRKIIHIDMDSFYASVEVRDNPRLKGRPVAVGGSVQTRGVLATCSYEARKFGIHSAMPVSIALRKCPELIILPVRMTVYKEVSTHIHAIFLQYTDLVEPLSLDEAFLDVTNVTLCKNSATLMAKKIRQEIFTTQGLTASAGIAPNKFLAKVASDWNKPNGQKVITPDEVDEFVYQLPVNCISGVGKVTAKRMTALNLKTCGDLQALGADKLKHYFGKFGDSLYHYSKGIDHRPVKTHRVRKSLSVEDTFPKDLPDLQSCLEKLPAIYQELLTRLQRAQQQQRLIAKTLFIKIRFDDFETTTLQTSGTKADLTMYQGLCKQAWQRGQRPVRLIGIGLRFSPPDIPEQLPLFKDSTSASYFEKES